jgi:hypothetical protein
MPSHKKFPTFLRVISNNKVVVCINPLQLSSFQILEKAKIKVKEEVIETDTIRFYFPSGTGLSYSVGVDITQEEFNYICSALLEYLYLTETEFRAKSIALEKAKMDRWNEIAQEEVTPTIPKEPEQAPLED